MSVDANRLRDLYLDVAEEASVTEPQADERSHEPIDGSVAAVEREVSDLVREDGLEDAIESAETGAGA